MAGPLAGIGQQQVPLAQPFQPGGSDASKIARQQQEERTPQNNEIQKTRSSQAAQTRETDSENTNRNNPPSVLSASNSNEQSSAPARGSLVNITV